MILMTLALSPFHPVEKKVNKYITFPEICATKWHPIIYDETKVPIFIRKCVLLARQFTSTFTKGRFTDIN